MNSNNGERFFDRYTEDASGSESPNPNLNAGSSEREQGTRTPESTTTRPLSPLSPAPPTPPSPPAPSTIPTTVSDHMGYPGAVYVESTERNSEDGSDAVDVPAFATYIDAHAVFPPLFAVAGNSTHQTDLPTQGSGLADLGRFFVFANEVVASTQEDQQQDDAPSLLHVTGDVRTVSFAALDAEIHRRNLSAWRR